LRDHSECSNSSVHAVTQLSRLVGLQAAIKRAHLRNDERDLPKCPESPTAHTDSDPDKIIIIIIILIIIILIIIIIIIIVTNV